jgi:sterol O-acyltransferase
MSKNNPNEKIEELISALQNIKTEKSSLYDNNEKKIQKFLRLKEGLNTSSQKIVGYLNLIKEEIGKCEEKQKEICNFISPEKNIHEPAEKHPLKIFKYRRSLLTSLMNKDSYQTIYNIFLTFLIFMIGISVTSHHIENKDLLDTEIFSSFLQGFSKYIYLIFVKNLIGVVFVTMILLFKRFSQNFIVSLLVKVGLLALLYFIRLLPTDGMSLLFKLMHYLECFTLLIKIYVFYLEKIMKVSLKHLKDSCVVDEKKIAEISKNKTLVIIDDGENGLQYDLKSDNFIKDIKNFVYFYFAPTLVYRDLYPLEKEIKIYEVIKHFLNLSLSVIFAVFMFETKINPMFDDAKLSLRSKETFVQTLVGFVLYSILILFMLFYGVIHSLMNLYGELTKFGDRNFYGSFYTASSPEKFYKKLFSIYEDFLCNYFKAFYSPWVFYLIRLGFYSFVAEYSILNATGFRSPIFSCVFILTHLVSIPFKYFKTQKKILFSWFILSFGMGILFMFEYIEYFVHISKQWSHNNSLSEKLYPKIFYILFY